MTKRYDRTEMVLTFVMIYSFFVLLAGIFLPIKTAAAESVYTNAEPISVSFSLSAETKEKLSLLREAFPSGSFWNYHDKDKLGSAKQWAVTVNGKTYYASTKRCSESNREIHDVYKIVKDNRTYCQSNIYHGSRSCVSFAGAFFEMLWGKRKADATEVRYSEEPNLLDLLLPGDILVIYSGGHNILITGRNEDGTLEYVDCNGEGGGNCKIVWEHTTERFKKWKDSFLAHASGYAFLHDPDASYRQLAELRRKALSNAKSATDPETGHVYSLMPYGMSWSAARSYARSLGEGYDLATMDGSSANEQNLIENLVEEYDYACWLGGSCTGGTWQWVNGAEISTSDARWDTGEPSGKTSSGSTENYLGIYANSTQTSYATINKWNDFKPSSSTIKGFVIEYTPPEPDVSWTPLYYQRATYALESKQGYLKAEPYENAENLFRFSDSIRVVETSGAYKNKYGNVWLKVERVWLTSSEADAIDLQGYVYAGHAHYGFSEASASFSGSVLPSDVIQKGEEIDIDARITSTDSITSVSVFLYQLPSYSLLLHKDFTDAAVLGDLATTVDLDSLKIEEALNLSALDAGEYALEISVPKRVPENVSSPGSVAYSATFLVEESGIQEISFTRPAGSFTNRLSALKEVFPEGWYWNNWSSSQLGGGIQYNITIGNHATSVSSVPCGSSHSDNQYWGAWHGTKACGFARMLFDLTWNMDTEAECYCYNYSMSSDEDGYILDYLAPGNMIYTGGNGVNRYYYVTAVDGDTVTYATCNADGNCGITWNKKTTKQVLLTEMEAGAEASPKVSGYICSPVPIIFDAAEFSWEPYTVTDASAVFKRTASTSSTIVNSFVLYENDIFYVGMNHLFEDKNGVVWGYCRTTDNRYGWIRMNGTSYKPATVTNPSISMLSWDEGTSVAFIDPKEDSFAVGSRAIITLLDTSVSDFRWETTDDSVFKLETDPENNYRCTVTALSAGAARIMVAGITSPEFPVQDPCGVEYEGAVFTFEKDGQTGLILEKILQSAERTRIPSAVNGQMVTRIAGGTLDEDREILSLEIENGIRHIYSDAFAFTLRSIQSVSIPESVQIIGTGAFAFDYPVFADFYFDGMYTMFETDAIYMDTVKLGDAPIYGVDYCITFHCLAGSTAESYALDRGWNVVYTDLITLSFETPTITLFSGLPFSMQKCWDYKVEPENLQHIIQPEFTVSNDCVIADFSGIWPLKPGKATVTASYGDATATVNVMVIGRDDVLILPANTKVIDQQAFCNNRHIQAVILPDGVERIESGAFSNCSSLQAVWCPASLEFIAPDAFSGSHEVCLYMDTENQGVAYLYALYNEMNYELCE